jgi:hypothetical protein
MTTTFDLPQSFDVEEFLITPRLQLHADDARWLVSTILRKTANRDTDLWGCVRLHSRILRRIMYEPTMGDVICALEHGAIETLPYCAGVKAKGFRLAERYLGDRCVRVPAVDPRLMDRLEQERQRWHDEQVQCAWKPIHYLLDADQRQVTIDPMADAILAALPERSRLCQDVLVGNLRHREFPFSVSTTGRVFNGITGLKRELRAALRIGGEPMGGVDIACAQPALLALEITRNSPSNGLKKLGTYKHRGAPPPSAAPPLLLPDADAFASLVASGLFYESLMDATGLPRDRVKLAFLRDVLAKRGRYPSDVEQAFREAFPSVHAFIRSVNRHDHGDLIRHLQHLESWLVVEQVAPRLIGRVPCLTLHDAIYSTLSSLPTVEAAFAETFEALGIRLKVKTEAASKYRYMDTGGRELDTYCA